MGVMHPDLVMRNMIPVVMAGVLGIYGLIVAVILNGKMDAKTYGLFDGYAHLAAGLSCGLSGLGSGMALGLYGLIVAIVLSQQSGDCGQYTPPQ